MCLDVVSKGNLKITLEKWRNLLLLAMMGVGQAGPKGLRCGNSKRCIAIEESVDVFSLLLSCIV